MSDPILKLGDWEKLSGTVIAEPPEVSLAETVIPASVMFAFDVMKFLAAIGDGGCITNSCEASLYTAACKCVEQYLAIAPIYILEHRLPREV